MLATLIPANASFIHAAKTKTIKFVKFAGLIVNFEVRDAPAISNKAIEASEILLNVSSIQASISQ